MKKLTVSILVLFVGLFTVSAQADLGKNKSDMLRRLFSQKKSNLKVSPVDQFGAMQDSSIMRTQDGTFEYKIVYKFETQKDTWTFYTWDDELEILTPDVKDEYYYNKESNDSLYIFSQWEDGHWVPVDKTRYIYDTNGVLIYEYIYYPDDNNNQWILSDSLKTETAMNTDDSATVASKAYYWYEDGIWTENYKYDYIYDNSGRVLSEIYSEWDVDSSRWIPDERYSSEYRPDGKLTNYRDEYWGEETQSWNPYEDNIIFSYDDKGRVCAMDMYVADEETGMWNMTEWAFQMTYYYPGNNTTGIRNTSAANVNMWSYDKNIFIESESELYAVCIYNMAGKLLSAQRIGGTQVQIDGMPFHSGIYIINIRTANGQTKASKIVLR